jgi:hypothetical protein
MNEDFELDKKIGELKKAIQLLDDRVTEFSEKLEKGNVDDIDEVYPKVLEALKEMIKKLIEIDEEEIKDEKKKELIITLKWLSVKLAEKLGIIYKESKEFSIL